MPIPTNIVTTARFSGNQIVQPVFNYWPAEVVETGTINNTPIAYPIGQINVNWNGPDYTNIELGQLWIIRDGDNIVSYGVVRQLPTSSILYIDGKSRGDPGLAVKQAFGITGGQTVTVYTVRPLWSLLSRIVDGEFFKKFDVAYTDEGSNPSPVVNIGSWRQAWTDPLTSTAELSFDNNNSFAWNDKTLDTYLWEVPGSATFVSGSSSSDSITITLPEGFHLIKCTVTDSGSATTTATRPVWVNSDSFPPLSEQYAFEIGGDSQDRKGRNQSLTFVGELDYDTYLPGTAFHYSEVALYDGEEITPEDILINNFAGFASEELRVHDLINGEKATSFEVFGPWAWMELIPMVSQAIVETEAPAAWTDIAQGLGIPQFIIWYVLKHHSTYLDLFDYDPLFEFDAFTGNPDDPRKLNWGLNGSTLADYVNQVAKSIGGNAGCKSDGTLAIRRNPNIEFTGFRDSVDERMTLSIDVDNGIMDFAEPLEVFERFHNEVGQIRVFTLSYNGTETTAFGSIAPGYTQMQAPGSQDEDSYIVKPEQIGRASNELGWRPGGQLRTNQLSGHLLAKLNNPTPEISGVLVRNMDFFNPAEMAWVRLEVPAEWSSRGVAINTRALPITVDRSWEEAEGGAFVKIITLSIEPETFGQPGETYNIDTGGGELYIPDIPPIGVNIGDDEKAVKEAGTLFAINADGELGRTKDGGSWDNIRGNIVHPDEGSTKFQDIAFNVYTEYPQSGFVEGALGAWVAVAEEFSAGSGTHNIIQIWYTEDCLQQNVEWVMQYSFDNGGSNSDGSVRLRANIEEEGYTACVVGSNNGMYLLRTTDGTSWSLTGSGNTVGDNSLNGAEEEVDFAFYGSGIISSGWDTSSSKWLLTRFATKTATYVFVANSPESDIPWPMIEKHINDNTVYATKIDRTVNVGTASIRQVIVEQNPQTALNSPGSEVPIISETTTGFLSSSQWNPAVRGDPNNGYDYDDPEPPLVAGYHDSDRVTPETSICGPATFAEYDRDDGWLFNDERFAPVIQNDPTDLIKFAVFIGIKGRYDWVSAAMNGFFTFTSATGSSSCNTLASQIGSHFVVLELFDRFGEIQLQLGGTKVTDADGWSLSENNGMYPTLSKNVSFGLIRFSQPGVNISSQLNYMQPTCKEWEFEVENVTIEEPVLYSIDDITTGTPTYNDITQFIFGDPDDTVVPVNPYSFVIDAANPADIYAVMKRTAFGGASYIATSPNSGLSWIINTAGETRLRGARLSNGFGLGWGYNRMDITEDNFATNIDIIGDWEQVFGAEVGLARVLKGILIPEA